jgi:hypothetical protein
MEERQSLLQIVSTARPGATIDTFPVGKLLVVGLTYQAKKTWIALDHYPSGGGVEDILGCLANMLVCCDHCGELTHGRCYFEHRLISERMRRFLGDQGYEKFLAHAPIRRGRPTPLNACSP